MMTMMSREDKVMASVKKAQDAGYIFLGKGTGNYDEALASNRNAGYDVRCWYTSNTKDARTWIMYGRVKGQRQSAPKPVEINYEEKTSKELKELCKSKQIKGYGKMNKEQMIQALKSN